MVVHRMDTSSNSHRSKTDHSKSKLDRLSLAHRNQSNNKKRRRHQRQGNLVRGLCVTIVLVVMGIGLTYQFVLLSWWKQQGNRYSPFVEFLETAHHQPQNTNNNNNIHNLGQQVAVPQGGDVPVQLNAEILISETKVLPQVSADSNNSFLPLAAPANAKRTIRLSFVGNSILFFNDFPRLLQDMLETAGYAVTPTGSGCLKGSTSFPTLVRPHGCPGKLTMAQSQTFDLDVVVLNDQTQYPALPFERGESIKVLKSVYAPWFLQHGVTPIFLQTAAYKSYSQVPLMMDVEFMHRQISQGYQEYIKVVNEFFQLQQLSATAPRLLEAKLAPVGEAFYRVHHSDKTFWYNLFLDNDDRHPNHFGALLQAYIVFATMTGESPPIYRSEWWEAQAKNRIVKLPNRDDALALWQIGMRACGMLPTA